MKILILRFSSIGDIVLTSPLLRCIKEQKPEYEIHFATKAKFETLIRHNPYIDKIHCLDSDLNTLIKILRAEQYDIILDLHKNIRTRIIRSALRVKTFAFDKINWEKWLMVKFKLNILPYEHIVDRYMATTHTLHVHNDGKGLNFFIDPNATISAFNLPTEYSVYAIGAQHATKKLPLHKQIELLENIKGITVLIGGKEDEAAGSNLASKVSNCINLCGRISVHQSALMMQNASRVYTHDTGMMHIAAALQKPITSIWGNTIPEFGMGPYYGNTLHPETRVLEVADLYCRPCSKIGFNQCPKGHFNCMELQEFEGESQPEN